MINDKNSNNCPLMWLPDGFVGVTKRNSFDNTYEKCTFASIHPDVVFVMLYVL